VVLDQQDPISGCGADRSFRHGDGGRRRGARQAHDELAPAPFAVAARLDRAAVHLDDAPHEREAHAETASHAVAPLRPLLEEIEYARQYAST
jgi:hypothetical protein